MNLADYANLGTTVGALVSALTLLSGFILYYLSKRDSSVYSTKEILVKIREACESLNNSVTYELAHEISEAVIFCPAMTYNLRKIWIYINEKERNIDEIKKYIDDDFPPVTIPIHTPLTQEIDAIIRNATSDLAKLRNTNPGIYRVASPVIIMLSNIITKYKGIIRDDEIWKKMLVNCFQELYAEKSEQDLQHRILYIQNALLNDMAKKDQEDIDDMLSIMDMTFDKYLGMNTRKVSKISRKERKLKFLSPKEAPKVTDDLRDAEKFLLSIFNQHELLSYREMIVKVEQRHKDKTE